MAGSPPHVTASRLVQLGDYRTALAILCATVSVAERTEGSTNHPNAIRVLYGVARAITDALATEEEP